MVEHKPVFSSLVLPPLSEHAPVQRHRALFLGLLLLAASADVHRHGRGRAHAARAAPCVHCGRARGGRRGRGGPLVGHLGAVGLRGGSTATATLLLGAARFLGAASGGGGGLRLGGGLWKRGLGRGSGTGLHASHNRQHDPAHFTAAVRGEGGRGRTGRQASSFADCQQRRGAPWTGRTRLAPPAAPSSDTCTGLSHTRTHTRAQPGRAHTHLGHLLGFVDDVVQAHAQARLDAGHSGRGGDGSWVLG